MSLPSIPHWTPDDYLAFERRHPDKHAYVDGRVIRQAGGSQAHAMIGINITSSLHQQLRTRECSVYGSDMRVQIPHANAYVYPDVSVVCGAAHFADAHDDTLTNPVVLIEVLSPATERYDRGKKFQAYQTIDTFSEYLLVAQDTIMIEHFIRHTDKLWTFSVVTDRASAITLTSIQCVLQVEEIYAKVRLDAPSELPAE